MNPRTITLLNHSKNDAFSSTLTENHITFSNGRCNSKTHNFLNVYVFFTHIAISHQKNRFRYESKRRYETHIFDIICCYSFVVFSLHHFVFHIFFRFRNDNTDTSIGAISHSKLSRIIVELAVAYIMGRARDSLLHKISHYRYHKQQLA